MYVLQVFNILNVSRQKAEQFYPEVFVETFTLILKLHNVTLPALRKLIYFCLRN